MFKMQIQDIERYIAQKEKSLQQQEIQKAMKEKEKLEIEKELIELDKQLHESQLTKMLLEKASDGARENGKKILEKTASSSLQMVLGDNHSVEIEMDISRGVPIANMNIAKEYPSGKILVDPTNEDGGGLSDLVSLSTFMALGMLVGEENQAGYFLDEPTKYVDNVRAEPVSTFIREIVDYTQKQTILVTHEDNYLPNVADRVYRIMNEDGVSKAVLEK